MCLMSRNEISFKVNAKYFAVFQNLICKIIIGLIFILSNTEISAPHVYRLRGINVKYSYEALCKIENLQDI